MLCCSFFRSGPIAAPAPWCATRRISTPPNAKSAKKQLLHFPQVPNPHKTKFYTFRKCQIHIKPHSTLPNAKSIKKQLLRFPEMPNPHKTKFYTLPTQVQNPHKTKFYTFRKCQIHIKPNSTLPNAKFTKKQLLPCPEMPNPHKTKFYTPQRKILCILLAF